MRNPNLRRAARGVSLLEAMIALLVAGFGLATIGGFQLGLSRHADIARQRSEATRLAQEKIETWRAFEQVAAAEGRLAYADLAAGSDAPALASNTAFARSWTVMPGAGDLQRLVGVRVAWTDRAGEPQGIALHSVIARSDPLDSGSLALPAAGNTQLRRPRERSLEIPFAATRLLGTNRGRSTLAWNGASGGHLVFDDLSGAVLARCAAAPTDTTDLASACIALDAYLLEGYIGGALPAGGLTPLFDRLEYLAAAPECVVAPALDARSGATLEGLAHYRCLLRPADHDGDAATPRVWSGRLRLAGASADNTVCRYTGGTAGNADHPETYRLVTSSLSQQNFFIGSACPAGSVALPGGAA